MQPAGKQGGTIWERRCPSCDAAFRVPMFSARRRRERSCTNCGAQLELELPGFAYYAFEVLINVVTAVLAPLLVLWMLFDRNGWAYVGVAALLVFALGSSLVLTSSVRVRWVNEEPGRRAAEKAGRWYPD